MCINLEIKKKTILSPFIPTIFSLKKVKRVAPGVPSTSEFFSLCFESSLPITGEPHLMTDDTDSRYAEKNAASCKVLHSRSEMRLSMAI